MAVPVFDPDAPSEEVAAPRFDPSQAFEEVSAPRFDPSKPFEEVSPSFAAAMAAATRHTVGVVERAIAATDVARAGMNAETEPSPPEAVATDEWGRPLDPRGRNPAQLNPAHEGARLTGTDPLARAMTPILPLRQAFSQGEQLSYLAEQQPEGAAKTALHAAGDVVTGAEDLVGGVAEFMTSPVGIATLGLGAAPAAFRGVVSAGFAADMANHAASDYKAFQAAKAAGDNVGQAEAIASGLRNLGMAGLAGSHSYREAYRVISKPELAKLQAVAPLTAEAVVKAAPIETKVAEPLIAPEQIKQSETPLTTAAVESVKKEPVPETPTPTSAKPEGERTLTTEPVATPAPKWTAATRAGVDLGKQTLAGIPDPVATIKAVIALAKEASPYIKRAGEAVARAARSTKEGVGEFVDEQMKAQRMTDYRRSVLNWSSKHQQSFGEADAAQKEIRKAVPDAVRREGITNWIQANGDPAVLRSRADATTDPKLKAGYEAALSLTPSEIAVANDVRTAFAELGARGQTYEVLNSFKENYVTQTWDLGRGPATGGSRTLKEKFRFSKASTFPTYFDGEQAGYVPKTKDIAKILPMYLHEMNSVIAARQLVQEMAVGVGSDGRPLVAARGGGVPVEGTEGKATLIMPKKVAKDTGDYKVLENQPALTGWRWASKDTDGNPIFLKADLALHPEAYAKLKSVLGQSAIKEWYQTRTSTAAQIPKLLVKAIDVAQNETKRTMLGFFAPFHQVQEGTHAVGHRINPFFSIPKIDLVENAGQLDATKHGLMLLPDRISAEQFMEGFRHSGLISAIPKIGPAADWYSHYLFQEYIPGLKFKTYEHILERNSKVYEKELASGAVKAEDIKVLSAEQANAAYGHLNYADLARNPTVQHMARAFLLAPDFFEARARFTAQGAKGIGGAKVGREQILALATLAITQAVTAWIAAETTGGHWDAKHPFEMVHGDRRYSMRSVPEDIAGLIADSRKFIYSRLSPLVGKGIVQGLSGVDYKGDKVSAGDTAKELAQAPIPLPLRGFLGTSHRNLTAFEELAGSVGLRISRYMPKEVSHAIQLRDEVDLWINRSKKLDSDEERASYLQKQLNDLSPEDRKKAVTRIKQRTAPGVRRRVR